MHTQKRPLVRRGKSKIVLGVVLPALLLAGGCETAAGRGMAVGGGLGALTGGIIGAATGHPGAGMAAGGALGAIAGGATGASIDADNQRQARRMAAAQAARPPLSLEDVQRLSASGLSDAVIVEQIRTSGTVYRLTADQILWLQKYGVREPVIHEMQETAYRAPPPVYVDPGYVYGPPPVAVGVGFGYGRRW